jgi:CRP-like cAMP-binding protein
MEPRELLGLVAFFYETLDVSHLDTLAAGLARRSFPEGAALIKEGDPAASMFVLASGGVAVTVEGEEVARLYVGDIVGEMSLLTGSPRSANVTAIEPVDAYEIDKAALAPILAASPALVERFAETLEKRQIELDKLQGGAAWGMVRLGKAELVKLIQDFYAGS